MDWDTIPMTGIAIGSKGSTRERASWVLIRAQDTAGRGGRAFGLVRLCLLIFNSPCCFHSSVTIPSCSWPCSGCFHSHPQLPVPCHYSYKRARAVGVVVPLVSVTRSADVPQWNLVSLAKSAGFVVVRCLQSEGLSDFCAHGGICQPCDVSVLEQGQQRALWPPAPSTLRLFGACSAASRAGFVQPLECQFHIALSKGSRCKYRGLDKLFIFELWRHSLKILRMMVTRSKQTKRMEPFLNIESWNESLEQKSSLKNLSSYHAAVFMSR